jgi:protein TonB
MQDPLQTHGPSRGLWIGAAVVALSLHAALGAIAIARMESDEAVDLGAPGYEIGIEIASPVTPPSELPPGPDSDASMATPPMVQQQEVTETALPRDTPTETEEADQQVSEQPAEKPEEAKPEVQAQPTPPSEVSVAQEATAMPSVETPQEARKSVTPDPGTGRSKQRVRASWQRELIAHLDKHKRYPGTRAEKSAAILIDLVLDRTGRVVSATIRKSSQDSAFDQAALDMIRRADPMPTPPALVADDGLTFVLPVDFNARDAERRQAEGRRR